MTRRRMVNEEGLAAMRTALAVLSRPWREAPLFVPPAPPPKEGGTARLLDESDPEGPVGLYDERGNLKVVMPQDVFWRLRERGGRKGDA